MISGSDQSTTDSTIVTTTQNQGRIDLIDSSE